MSIEPEQQTHFGFRKVQQDEKSSLVAEVFKSVAPKYDLMNDLMSFGMHRLWKRFTIQQASVKRGQRILDVAAGTGDLSKAFARLTGPAGKVVMSDINEAMLETGRNRLLDQGIVGNIDFILADAEHLPFPDHDFDLVTIAFGLRNVTDKLAALKSMYRVLKPGGKLLVLEFSKPQTAMLSRLYDVYSFNIIPKIGGIVANDSDSYQYLVESIRMHPDQETLKSMMCEAGFEDVTYFNLSGGIVALHQGYKF
jgi:demethylmenaquinone methyltransferase / 2-methoxy-6-polyprenyl-1,4-benzoquinol methylase